MIKAVAHYSHHPGMGELMTILRAVVLSALLFLPACSDSEAFTGLESTTLEPVSPSPGQWGLKIVFFDVGQADAILLIVPNGDVALIDTGRTKDHGEMITQYLMNGDLNGVGVLPSVRFLYVTHYDADHIGGLPRLEEGGISVVKAFDQGPSGKRMLRTDRGNPTVYSKYLNAVGDPKR